jgi:phage terminase large subunit
VPTTVEEVLYKPRGPHKDLFRIFARAAARPHDESAHPPAEILVEGPAGTAKSRNILEVINYLLETIEGEKPYRVLLLRKTRVSLNDSVLFTLEEEVLGPVNHPVLDGASREHRTRYVYPNGNQIVLGGMDNPTKLFSTQYDLIYINEANELTEAEYESLFRALRNFTVPWQAVIVDCNPDVPQHWLNKRPEKPGGAMVRIVTRHKDNPMLFGADGQPTAKGKVYMARLDQLTGVRRKRLRDGLWVAAEGQIYENFDPAVHVVDAGEIDPKDTLRPWGCNLPPFEWYGCSQDFGFRDAQVLQLWGITKDKSMYRLREFYRTRTDLEWWGDRFAEWYKRWDVVRLVCDHRPELIRMFNQRVGFRGNGSGASVAIPARKGDGSIESGTDLVRTLLGDPAAKPGEKGYPRLFFVRQGRDRPDPLLRDAHMPTCTEDEIPGYVFLEHVDGKPIRNRPDPACQDHGCDATRYMAMYVWLFDHGKVPKAKKWHPDSYGAWLGHDEVDGV